MGIQSYLKKVSKATSDIKDAINDMGGNCDECASITTLASAVRAIPTTGTGTGDSLFTVLAFKQSTSKPSTPTGGSWNSSADSITYPSGWTDGAGLTKNVWLSYKIYKADGTVYKNWVEPIIVNGLLDGDDPIDLTDLATKTWVAAQLEKITTGTIDLSSYATKSYVDSAISKITTGGGNGVTSVNSITGAVTLAADSDGSITISKSGNTLSFKANGGSGTGKDGDTYRTFNIYINTDSNVDAPEIPADSSRIPYWDTTNNTLENCPAGWADEMHNESDKYTWMASATFSKNSAGAMVGTWVGPLCITGTKGQPGKDGSNFEFIYALSSDADVMPNYPTTASEQKKLFDAVEQGDSSTSYSTYNGTKWYDRAQVIDSTVNKACWVAQRVKYSGADDWNFYSQTPVLWAHWGSDGTDGDGVEYIFFLTDDAHQNSGKWYSDAENYEIDYTKNGTVNGVSTAYSDTVDDWVPVGWTDEPQDVSQSEGFYEFCATRKSKNGKWQKFSAPALWAKFAMDGKDGASIEYVFATTNDEYDEADVSVDNTAANADGAHTTDEYLPNFIFGTTTVKATDDPKSISKDLKYQWVSIRRRKAAANAEWSDFSHPALWNVYSEGSQGPKGEDGDTIEEVFVLKNSVAIMPTIDATSTDSAGRTAADDGYLPKFNFAGTMIEGSSDLLSVSQDNRFRFKTRRRKHEGVWLDFMTPAVDANWTELELTTEEIDEIKTGIKNDLKDQLDESTTRVTEISNRLDSIDYTNAEFVKDKDNALIKAITQYKNDNSESFADLVINGQESKISAVAAKQIDEQITDAGITINGAEGTVKTFADYLNKATGQLNTVGNNIDAINGTLDTYAIKLDNANNNINSVQQKLDANEAAWTSSVSKSAYVWVKRVGDVESGDIVKDSAVAYDVTAYTGSSKKYDTQKAYEAAMAAQNYFLEIQVNAFSQIKQTAGEVNITAGDGKAAQLKIYGDNSTSKVIMKAEEVEFSGNMNGKGLTVTNLVVTGDPTASNKDEKYGAKINYATIDNCLINSCEIVSQIKSQNFNGHNDTENNVGSGFLLDGQGGQFALYGEDGSRLTDTGIIVPAASITGKLTADQIDASSISVSKLQSKDYSDTAGAETGFLLDASGDSGKFALYGRAHSDPDDDTSDLTTIFKLTNDSLTIDSASITNLYAENIGDLTNEVDGVMKVSDLLTAIQSRSADIAGLLKGLITADLEVRTLKTNKNGKCVYIGNEADAMNQYDTYYTPSESLSTSVYKSTGHEYFTFNSTPFTIPTAASGQTIEVVIPEITTRLYNHISGNHDGLMQSCWIFIAPCSESQTTGWSKSSTKPSTSGVYALKSDSESQDGLASGKNHNFTVTSDSVKLTTSTLTGTTYCVRIVWDVYHGGRNWNSTSRATCYLENGFTVKINTTLAEKQQGVFISPTGVAINGAGDKQIAVGIDDAGEITTNGFVISPVSATGDQVQKIQIVSSASACTDSNTLYIILA